MSSSTSPGSRRRRSGLLAAVVALCGGILVVPSAAAAASPYYASSHTSVVNGSSVTVTVLIKASSTRTVKQAGICAKNASGTSYNFPLTQGPKLTPTYTTFTGTRANFPAGSYSYHACVQETSGAWPTLNNATGKTFTVGQSAPSGASVLYVDSVAGSDSNAGTSQSAPLKSLTTAAKRDVDQVLVKRNSTFSSPVVISGSGTSAVPFAIGVYGSGQLPKVTKGSSQDCIVLAGNYIVLDSFAASGCTDGVRISGTNTVVQNSVLTGNGAGITVDDGANRCKVLKNTLTDNNKMIVNTPGGVDDYGALGIGINHADSCEIAYNTISGSHASSYDWGQDGAAIEIYGSTKTSVHHNLAKNNIVFAELGSAGTAGNSFNYNVVSSTVANSAFLTVHGGAGTFGQVTSTSAVNNTVVLTGTNGTGFFCDNCSSSVLNTTNNLVVANRIVGFTDPWGNNHNLHTSTPGFVNMSAGDYHLTSSSKAVNAGVAAGQTKDFDGKAVDQTPNIGAYEL